MAKPKRKLTVTEKAEKKRRQKEYMTIFINGKQKRVKRPPTIDGMDVDDFIRKMLIQSGCIRMNSGNTWWMKLDPKFPTALVHRLEEQCRVPSS